MIFKPVITKVMEMYQPQAVVLQCGADSLSGDRLGCFNLSLKGHAQCVEFVKKFGLPVLLLGGGGYTIRNVARGWAHETALCVDTQLEECVSLVKSFGLPVLLLGGGGYTIRNVSRCWAHETALCVDTQLDEALPWDEYYAYYAPDFKLSITPSNMINKNTKHNLQKKLNHLLEILKEMPFAPSTNISEMQ